MRRRTYHGAPSCPAPPVGCAHPLRYAACMSTLGGAILRQLAGREEVGVTRAPLAPFHDRHIYLATCRHCRAGLLSPGQGHWRVLGYGLVSRQGELLDQVKRRKRKQQDLRSLRSVACWHSGLASDSPPNDILTPPALDFCVLYAGDQAETYAALGAYVFANMPSVKKTLSDISMYSSTGRLK